VTAQRGSEKELAQMNIRISAGIASIGATLLISASGAVAYTGQEFEKDAQVSMAQASAIAVKARPGKITDRELEKEKGGSGLRFSFDVNSRGTTYEVGIDAATGKVLENDREGKNPD
jgi:uncharacterized membrane protein YkoI